MAGRNPKARGDKARSGRALVWFDALNPADGTPRPPAHLDQNAVFAWVTALRSLIPQRFVSHIDLLALEMFAEAFSRWRRAEARCKRGEEYAVTPNGHRQISAQRINANKALQQVMAIGSKLGMTPIERIKTTESAQGDLPLGAAVVTEQDDGDARDEPQVIASIFDARPVRLVSDNSDKSS